MRQQLRRPSRVVALLAALLALISSLSITALPASATEVVNGNCAPNVDNTSGVVTYESGTYCYVAFKSTGITYNWTRPGGVTSFDYIVVGGGGGGGTRHAAGGGAGGLVQLTAQTITASTISIYVGAGGAGASAQASGITANGNNGTTSYVSATGITTQFGYGGGAGGSGSAGGNGGSGGGGSCCGLAAGTGTAGQGNNGAVGWTGLYGGNNYWIGGAGGGAGATGTAATSSGQAGIGGAGASVSWITSFAQSNLGVGVWSSSAAYFAGGGGGGTAVFGTGGSGGVGGGGLGGTYNTVSATNGTANTGGGGGGGGMNSDNTSPKAGDGGSGVVVFRYLKQTPVFSLNASDINSYDNSVSTTAVNDLSTASLNDATLYNGTGAVAPGFNNSTGAWTLAGGASGSGPYGKLNTSLATSSFFDGATFKGLTFDFEADFGSALDNWERVIDFSAGAEANNNIWIGRNGTSSNLSIEIFNGTVSQGVCTYTGGIPANSGLNRWTIMVSGTTCSIYKNGSVVVNAVAYTAKPLSTVTLSSNLIGKSNFALDNSFEGSIRSVSMYLGALSINEIPAPNNKTITYNSFDGNAVNGGGVSYTLQTRLTSGSVKMPTPNARAGYTFTGWYTSTTFSTNVGSGGGTYTPSSTITLYGGWRTVDSSVTSNLVLNFDATNVSSFPSAGTSAASIWPGAQQVAASAVTSGTRDTGSSPGALALPTGTDPRVVSFGTQTAANISGALSFETWVKFSSIATGSTSWNVIASHWFADAAGTGATDWHFGIYNNRLQVNTGASNITIGDKVWSNVTDINTWYLLGFTIDASNNVQIYVNGRTDGAVGVNKPHAPNANANFWIGDGRTSSPRMVGFISRARLYNTALTSSQLLSNFSGEAVTYGLGPYTVTYKAGPNGTGSDVVDTYNAGTAITLKNNTAPFTRAGYYISGWTTSSTSGAAQTNALTSAYSVDSNSIFYPVWTATTYTVTYNYNGATGGNTTVSNTYAAGGTAITLPTPTKTNNVFGGWYTEAGLVNQVVSPYAPTQDITLYAKFTSTPYTVTFKVNGGNAASDVTQTVYAGVPVNLTANTFTKAHSSFSRWSDVANALSMNSWTDGQQITPTGNLTLYAIWNDDARIIFNSNGGSAVADVYTIGLPLAGATPAAKPTDPTKSGKVFAGWSTLQGSSNGDPAGIVTWPRDREVNSVETLYAIWLDACVPTKTTFVGTGTSDLTSATYGTNGVKYVQYRFNTVGSCTLAVPSEVTALDVLLVGGGGAGSYFGRAGGGGAGTLLHTTTPYSVTAGTNIPITVGAGGTFTYNATDGSRGTNGAQSMFANIAATGGGAGAGGVGTIQAAQAGGSGGGGACSTGYTTGAGGSINNYTGWTGFANVGGSATGTCTSAGGAGGGGAGGAGTNGTATGGAALTRFGVELAGGGAGWWPSAVYQGGGTVGGDWTNACPAAANDGVANTGSGGGSCGNGAAGTVIVRFAAPTYTITYNYNGATGGNSTVSADSIASTVTLPTPTKTGYVFNGWYSDAGLTLLYDAAGAVVTPTNDMTLYASWSAGNYTYTYVYNAATGGNTTSSQTYYTGNAGFTMPTPTKTGYTFGGWYLEAGFTTLVSGTQTPSASATLYAKWNANTYTLTYNYNGATGGNGTASATYTSGGTAITLPTPTKTGYTFGGWYAEVGLTTLVSGAQSPTADATLYAKWNAGTYTLTYNYNGATGGNGTATASYTTGGSAITLPTPTKTGYTFGGWYSDSGLTTAVTGTQTPSASATLYAKWDNGTFTLTYNYNGATGANATVSDSYITGGTAITMPSPTKTGYTFGGWYAEAGLTTLLSGAQTPSASSTVYAKWNAATFTLTYNYNGATGGNGSATASYTTGGSAITLPAPTKTGYNFAGWYSDAGLITSVTGTQTPSADATLYAKWTAINYTLTYNGNGSTSGAVPTDTNNYNIGGSASVAAAGTLARTGYTFAGWTVLSNGTGTVYGSGAAFVFGSANVILYAKWTSNTYTISYNVNGATGAQANANDSYTTGGSATTLSAVGTMAKTGYTFGGWATTANGTAVSNSYTTTADVTLYAVWNIRSINVTYSKGSAASASFIFFPSNTASNYATRITLSNNIDSSVTYSGQTYAFVGWSDGTSLYQSGVQYLLGATDVTLTAVWTPAFGVRYIFNGGTPANGTSPVDSECLVAGNLCTDQQSVTSNAAPTRDGYTFNGWVDQSNNQIAAGANFTVTINSYLLYAQWTAINYSVTYAPNGGASTPTETTKRYGDTFTLAGAITRAGYNFAGWSDGSTTYGSGASYTVGLTSITLTAVWTPKTYSISYDWNGGTGSAVANQSYTVGNSGVNLALVGDHVKDGYQFGGWALTLGGDAVISPFVATGDTVLYAIWGSGSYNITFNPNYGMQASSSTGVANGNSTVLPTPSRSNFVFDGWYTASTGGTKVGNGGATYIPSASRSLYARWIQSSLYGVSGSLNRISTINASDSVTSSYSGSTGGSSVAVTVPSGTLPAGSVVALDLITDNSYAQSVLTGNNSYILSIAVSWLAPDETVPNTNSGKSISMTISNSSIKAGALIYSVQSGVATLLGTATQDGTITVQLTTDPSLYIVATVPSAPRTVTTTPSTNSVVVTWTAPSTDGGSAITGYTVTLTGGQTCSTTLLTCTFSNLTAGSSYTATVLATNAVGSSVTGTSTFTLTQPQAGGGSVPVNPTPPVTPTPPTPTPPTPSKPIVVPVPVVKAVEKVLANTVPVLTGIPVIKPIQFDANSAKLDAGDLKQILAAAEVLKDKSGWLLVTGFVKYTGLGTAVEKKIATARAKAVTAQLAKLGLKVKIGFLGYGPHNKKSPSAADRKVELRWVDAPASKS